VWWLLEGIVNRLDIHGLSKTFERQEYHITTDGIWGTIHSNTSQVYLVYAKLLHNTTAKFQADYLQNGCKWKGEGMIKISTLANEFTGLIVLTSRNTFGQDKLKRYKLFKNQTYMYKLIFVKTDVTSICTYSIVTYFLIHFCVCFTKRCHVLTVS
jgi:hypothetical protein